MVLNVSKIFSYNGRGGRFLRWLGALILITMIGGCSSEDFKRMAYTLSTSYSCTQSNKHLPNKTLKDLECSNPVTSKEMSFEEYQKQRKQLLKQQD